MKFFGEYLVEKNVITEDQLLEALIEQAKMTPITVEIIFENQLMPSRSILDVIKYQFEHKTDFKNAALKLNTWSPQVEEKFQAVIGNLKKPLGHILVKKGFTDLPTITKTMDDFLSRMEAPTTPVAPSISSEMSPDQKPDSAAQNRAPTISDFFIGEFIHMMSPSKFQALRDLFLQLKDHNYDQSQFQQLMKKTLTEMHVLRGLMTTMKFEKSDQLLQIFEMFAIRLIDGNCDSKCLSQMRKFGEYSLEFLVLFESLIAWLKSGQSETQWHENKDNELKVKTLFEKTASTCMEVL